RSKRDWSSDVCSSDLGLTVATPLGAAATSGAVPEFSWDMVTGLIPGSIGETSVIAIALGAILLLWTGIASWKTMFSVFVGGAFKIGRASCRESGQCSK